MPEGNSYITSKSEIFVFEKNAWMTDRKTDCHKFSLSYKLGVEAVKLAVTSMLLHITG